MRYVILNKNISSFEEKSRLEYIQEITNLYYIPYKRVEGIEFVSLPSTAYDCLFIVGHNKDVERYIKNEVIYEKNIVVVSCKINIDKHIIKSKNIYVTYDDGGFTNYYDGEKWNLNFNISTHELKLINSKGKLMDKIKKYFRRIS